MVWPLLFNTICVTDSLQVRSENFSKYSSTCFRARARASIAEESPGAISPGGAWAAQGPPMKANAAKSATANHQIGRVVTREHLPVRRNIPLICGAVLQTGIRT